MVIRPAVSLLLVLAVAVFVAPAARAEGPAPEAARVSLVAEGWVATETAEIDVAADVTLVDQDPAEARAKVLAMLRGLDAEARWRVTEFGRAYDNSGAQRWTIRAMARVAQTRLDAIAAAAKRASATGRSFRVARIDTSPSIVEREAVLKELRATLYKKSLDEVAALRALWPGREVGVLAIDFTDRVGPIPRPHESRAALAVAAGGEAVSTERRLVLTATVTIGPRPAAPARK